MKYPEKIIDLCKMLDDKKAEDIAVCYLGGKNVVDYFLVATFTSSAHIKGTCDYILEECAKLPIVYGDIAVEGFSISNWLVMDMGDIFIHLFTKDTRNHFNFDKFINDGGNVISYKKLLANIEQEKKKEQNRERSEEKARLKQKAKEKVKAQKEHDKIVIKSENKDKKEGKK